jgi:aspartate carbamoyltransferase catalytic subunit
VSILPTIDGLHSSEALSPTFLESLFACAADIEAKPSKYSQALSGKVIATVFNEPSTRTRLSFESAAHRLGASVISVSDSKSTSGAKGESLSDMTRVVSSYADLMVLRHPYDGASRYASRYSEIPLINGGDGRLGHPTQTLVDLYTLHKKWDGKFQGKTVALLGDLTNGRTVRSLAWSLAMLGVKIVLLPGPGLDWAPSFEQRIVDHFDYRLRWVSHPLFSAWTGNSEARIIEPRGLVQKDLFGTDVLKLEDLDALYLTRLQVERGAVSAGGVFPGINSEIIQNKLLDNCLFLHPLPRRDELPTSIDGDRRAVYFEQAANGPIVRQAVFLAALAGQDYSLLPLRSLSAGNTVHSLKECPNENCVSRHEGVDFPWRIFGRSRRVFLCSLCDSQLVVDYIGCSSTRRFHAQHSPAAQRISPENMHPFAQRSDAEARGFNWGN